MRVRNVIIYAKAEEAAAWGMEKREHHLFLLP